MFILIRMAVGSAFLFLLSFILRVLELPLYSECMLTSIVVFVFSMVYIIGLVINQKIICSKTTKELEAINRSMRYYDFEHICWLVIGHGTVIFMVIFTIAWLLPKGIYLLNDHVNQIESDFVSTFFDNVFCYQSVFHKVLAYILAPISVLIAGLAGIASVKFNYIKCRLVRIVLSSLLLPICGSGSAILGMFFGYSISGLLVAILGIIFSGILGLLKVIGFIVLIIIGIAMLSSGSDESSRGYTSDFYTLFFAQDEAHEYARRNADTRYSGQLSGNAVKYIVDHPSEFDKDTWNEANRDYRS